MVKNPPAIRRHGFDPWGGKIPWRRVWQPTPVFLPGESHGQRSLAATVHGLTKRWTQLSDFHFHLTLREDSESETRLPEPRDPLTVSHNLAPVSVCSAAGRFLLLPALMTLEMICISWYTGEFHPLLLLVHQGSPLPVTDWCETADFSSRRTNTEVSFMPQSSG